MGDSDEVRDYLTVTDILTIHEVIVESSEETTPGVASRGDIEYVVEYVWEGHFGQGPETIHEKAAELLRLLVANHPFVDGNKRTALASVVTFYALNGYELRYDESFKEFLTGFATDERSVDVTEVRDYLDTHAHELPAESPDASQLWQDVIDHTEADETDRNDYP